MVGELSADVKTTARRRRRNILVAYDRCPCTWVVLSTAAAAATVVAAAAATVAALFSDWAKF